MKWRGWYAITSSKTCPRDQGPNGMLRGDGEEAILAFLTQFGARPLVRSELPNLAGSGPRHKSNDICPLKSLEHERKSKRKARRLLGQDEKDSDGVIWLRCQTRGCGSSTARGRFREARATGPCSSGFSALRYVWGDKRGTGAVENYVDGRSAGWRFSRHFGGSDSA